MSAVTGLGPQQADFFSCDILDAIPKDDMASMEHPIFSLSTRPDRRVLSYGHGEAQIEITPSVKGLATIHDKDILIYCISQLVAALNEGRKISRQVTLKSYDLLLATGRETSGNGYRRLREAFERLAGTRITTNIVTGGVETTRGFGLIDGWEIVRRTKSGRMISVQVTLSDWLYRAVMSKSVLTLSRQYFHLRKPLERRVYEIARKHCGGQRAWKISLENLLKKSGSASPRRVFRKMIRDMVAANQLPDYEIRLDDRDIFHVTPRGLVVEEDTRLPRFGQEVYEAAKAHAPGYDPHWLEGEWRAFWVASGRPALRSPERAYLAFCAKRARIKPLR
jgi:plasmid replication initiation protein